MTEGTFFFNVKDCCPLLLVLSTVTKVNANAQSINKNLSINKYINKQSIL